jgi:hypothetical protein
MSWTLPRLGEVRLLFWVDGPTVVDEAKSGQKIFTVWCNAEKVDFPA